MKELIGLSHEELKAELESLGEKPFREKQLWHQIYFRGETDFEKMTTLGKELRAKLAENYVIGRPKVLKETTGSDSTRKWLFGFEDSRSVETVYIRKKIAAPSAFPRKSAVRTDVFFAIRGRKNWKGI